MLANTLNTNEVKNAAGAEVELQRLSSESRRTEYGLITESPALPHRLVVAHEEIGTGINRRRRSQIRINKTVASTVDATKTVVPSAYIVIDFPIGGLTANTEMANVLAELCSFVSTLGTNTHLYDGTGTGAAALLSGGL
jgi:hypothetical protein